jgi:hypothetical protein
LYDRPPIVLSTNGGWLSSSQVWISAWVMGVNPGLGLAFGVVTVDVKHVFARDGLDEITVGAIVDSFFGTDAADCFEGKPGAAGEFTDGNAMAAERPSEVDPACWLGRGGHCGVNPRLG